MKTILHSRFAWLAALSAGIAVCLAALAADVPTVSTVSSLEGMVNAAWTNNSMAKIMPPGDFPWNNSLGVIAYETGFDTNFLAAIVPETNATFTLYPVEVIETNTTPRQRHYLNLTNGVAHTTTVSIANYPEDWIEDVYGVPPGWLSGGALTQWYADRDPRRQHVRFDLISTSDVPAYIAMLTNSVGSWSSRGTNINLCEFHSNDIAFVAIQADSAGIDVYLHAPTNVPAVDLFTSTNLLDTYGWSFPSTLDRVTDPILWTYYGSDPIAFFASGNAAVDTDGDGLADIREIRLYGTSAYLADSDGDGLDDGLEVMTYGLNPLNADSDGDGIPDGQEVNGGTNPNSADSDGDGITDYAEIYTYFGHVDPMDADSDNDGLNDYAEIVTYGTYAAPECSGAQDSDGDGLSDYAEVVTYGTNPRSVDSDGDGIDDGYEVGKGWNPLDAATATQNPDGDAFNNLTEYQWDYAPTSSNSTPPTSQKLLLCPHGTNSILHSDWDMLAAGDMGAYSARIRVRPFYQSGALAEQRLYHTQSPGFYINGTAASAVASPINVPASSTALEYTITSDATARGTNLYFRLTTTNEPTATKDSARCYYPEIEGVNFWGPGSANYVDVNYGQTNTLWIGMPANTNNCRVRMQPIQGPTHWYGIGYFHWTDWMLVKVTGSGADPASATLNTLDWQSAYGVWYNDITTRGIRLDPGSYTFEVGYDMNGNGTLDTAEVQETCRVHVPVVDINGDYNRDANPVDDPVETNAVPFAGPKGFVILANTDDDDGDGEPDGEKSGNPLNYYINGTNDLADINVLRFARLGIASNEMPDDLKVSISVLKAGTETTTENAIVYPVRQAGQQGYGGYFQLSAASTRALFAGSGTVDMGIEGRKYGEEVVVRMSLKKGSTTLKTDEVRLLILPFFVLSNCEQTTKVYSGAGPDEASWPILYAGLTNALNGVVPVEVIGSARFVQDYGEIGYTRLPPGMAAQTPTVVMDRGDSAFATMVDSNTCYFYFGGGNGGSVEAALPTSGQPYGTVIVGSINLNSTVAFLTQQKVQTVSNNLVILPTEWLAVKHADEVFTIVPSGSGFSVLVADLTLAIDLLRNNPESETGGGYLSRTNILAYYDANTAKVAYVEARLAAVRQVLSDGLGISQSQFIKIPVAFTVNEWTLAAPAARTYLPNTINMLVVKNTSGTRRLVMPDPFFAPILEDSMSKLTAAGYASAELRAINTSEAHVAAGEVHCATISRRNAP